MNSGPKEIETPLYWGADRKHNPFYVHKHRSPIARSIARKIQAGSYVPFAPQTIRKRKASGGFRNISIYQIPDNAVSRLYYSRLLKKNRHRFSSFSYAYRDDRNVHFAIQDIAIELARTSRLFIAEFDFSKFFDTIDHDYLTAQYDRNGFLINAEERRVIEAFLTGKEGIPQGTSISLFLANLVCWELDKSLERNGIQFARYADDTVIWSREYSKINTAFGLISDFSEKAGVAINPKKSEGISLLCDKDASSELARRKDAIDFLGYAVSNKAVSIKKESVKRIKQQISYILYKHLVQPLLGQQLRAIRIPANNQDCHLVSAILEIRRYLYGDLSDEMLRRYLNGNLRRLYFKGLMSFYPLLTDEDQLKQLDGWLVTAIHKAVRKRLALLRLWNFERGNTFPFNIPRSEIPTVYKAQVVNGKHLLRVPSFHTIFLAIKKGVADVGIEETSYANVIYYE